MERVKPRPDPNLGQFKVEIMMNHKILRFYEKSLLTKKVILLGLPSLEHLGELGHELPGCIGRLGIKHEYLNQRLYCSHDAVSIMLRRIYEQRPQLGDGEAPIIAVLFLDA